MQSDNEQKEIIMPKSRSQLKPEAALILYKYLSLVPVLNRSRRLDKPVEQGMGAVGTALELRMELDSHKPGVNLFGKLHYLDKLSVRGLSRKYKAVICELLAELVVELVAVAVTLVDKIISVGTAAY